MILDYIPISRGMGMDKVTGVKNLRIEVLKQLLKGSKQVSSHVMK